MVVYTPSKSLSAFPVRLTRTLRYNQSNTIDVANFGISSQVFRANSLYDPDSTGTGHQPNGFDTLMAAYDHFTVLASKIRVRTIQTGTGGGTIEPGGLILAWSDTGTFMASQTDYALCLEHRNVLASSFYGSSGIPTLAPPLEGHINIPRVLQKPASQIVDAANYRGTSAANPTEGYFFEIGLFSFSSNPGAITIVTEMEFDAVFTEPIGTFGDS